MEEEDIGRNRAEEPILLIAQNRRNRLQHFVDAFRIGSFPTGGGENLRLVSYFNVQLTPD